ncbi:MAG: HAD family hydrolase [Pseudomonadota bacterium]
MVQRIAMWSGPRNLSTALMYSFGNRADMEAVDEPFYAAYLSACGADHPMREAVLASQSVDPEVVAANLARAERHRYFKLMAHHMLPGFPMGWAEGAVHIHLIRHPARVIASYAVKREMPTLEDIGFPQQLRLIEALGGYLVDSFDIRRDPEGMLRRICEVAGVSFDPAMLAWEAGPKPFDGAWAPHWYDAVHRSTGFAGPEGPLPVLNGDAGRLLAAAAPLYRAMRDRAETLD